MKIKITKLEEQLIEVPKYFTLENNYCRVNNDETFFVVRKHYKENDFSMLAKETNLDFDKPIVKISKSEFVAHCNKAYKAITGFKHVEDLWVDKEGDAHE